MEFKRITIKALSPDGWPVDFEIDPATTKTGEATAFLEKYGYKPAPTAEDSKSIQYTPEGLPICPKHGEVMRKREKQGDTWYSHRVVADDGSEHFCRGYKSKNSPGWEH